MDVDHLFKIIGTASGFGAGFFAVFIAIESTIARPTRRSISRFLKGEKLAQPQQKKPSPDTIVQNSAVDSAGSCRQNYNQELQPAFQSPQTPQGTDNGFDRFWKVFPKKAGKKQAAKVWKRLNPSAELQATILKAVKAQAASEQWQDTRYIPHAERWLKWERWNDELPPATARPDSWARERDIGKHTEGDDGWGKPETEH